MSDMLNILQFRLMITSKKFKDHLNHLMLIRRQK